MTQGIVSLGNSLCVTREFGCLLKVNTWRENCFANNPRGTASTTYPSTSEYYSGTTDFAVRAMVSARIRIFASLCVRFPRGFHLRHWRLVMTDALRLRWRDRRSVLVASTALNASKYFSPLELNA